MLLFYAFIPPISHLLLPFFPLIYPSPSTVTTPPFRFYAFSTLHDYRVRTTPRQGTTHHPPVERKEIARKKKEVKTIFTRLADPYLLRQFIH